MKSGETAEGGLPQMAKTSCSVHKWHGDLHNESQFGFAAASLRSQADAGELPGACSISRQQRCQGTRRRSPVPNPGSTGIQTMMSAYTARRKTPSQLAKGGFEWCSCMAVVVLQKALPAPGDAREPSRWRLAWRSWPE